MDEIKRKLTFNKSSEEKTKKLRNESNQSITYIEDLFNELFHEVFDYLDTWYICKAFSNLNHRFQQLLTCSAFLFKQKVDIRHGGAVSNEYMQFILLHRDQMLSINVSLPYDDDNYFFSSLNIDPSFNRLESVVIGGIKIDIFISLLINLASLPRLFSLNVLVWNTTENLNDMYRLIFALPVLKYNKLIVLENKQSISLPMATDKQLSTIEYLVIQQYCTFNELATLISYTPQLRRLNILNATKYIQLTNGTILPLILPHLTNIYMFFYYIVFDELEIFIRKMYSKLKILCITGFGDCAFIDAHRWEQIILQCFPQLEKFYLTYYERVNYQKQYALYAGGPNQFCSSFWTERQWVFGVEIDGIDIKYSVRPYRKRWYEYTQDTINNSSVELSKSTGLKLSYNDSDECRRIISVDINHVLTVAQIYHLEISGIPRKKIFRDAFIEMINLLSELTTLSIHSLSYQPIPLNENQNKILRSTKDTSKITKVYLEEMNEIGQFSFLLLLCPYMAYFKVGNMKNIDVQFFLRHVFQESDRHYYDHLRSLSLRVPLVDDKMIKNLEEIINSEKLLVDFSIKRICDTIHLQWK